MNNYYFIVTVKRTLNKKGQLWLFKRWRAIPTGQITIQPVAWFVLLALVH